MNLDKFWTASLARVNPHSLPWIPFPCPPCLITSNVTKINNPISNPYRQLDLWCVGALLRACFAPPLWWGSIWVEGYSCVFGIMDMMATLLGILVKSLSRGRGAYMCLKILSRGHKFNNK